MLKIINAQDPNGVIGLGNKMPWNISEEFELFRKKTIGGKIVLGRSTVEGMGKLLDNRETIILSETEFSYKNAEIITSVEEIVKRGEKEDIWIGGGRKVYELLFEYVSELHISILRKKYDGDVYFPKFNRNDWLEVSREEYKEFIHYVWRRK